jgi:hypothetical protein
VGAAHENANGRRRGLTPAQWYCLLIGLSLLLAGVFGFLADASFDIGGTGDTDRTGNADGQLQGDGFLGFEVNAWHNIVHLATGAFLVFMAASARSAITGALVFGVVYVVVTIWGFIDGNDILTIVPINTADNFLHLALALVALAIGISAGGLAGASRKDTREAT